MAISVRSYLTAGIATVAVSVIAIAPIERTAAETIGARLYQLSAAVQPFAQPANAAAAVLGAVTDTAATIPGAAAAVSAAPAAASASPAAAIPSLPDVNWPSTSPTQSAGDFIINVYNAVQPWFEWGWSVVAWAAGYLPLIGFFAQQINIAYATIEPLVQAVVYSFAYLLDGAGELIPQIIANGFSSAWNNFIQGEIAWIESFLPPLPPIGSVSSAAATAPVTTEAPTTPTAAESAATESAATTIDAPTSGRAGFKPTGEAADETKTAPEATDTTAASSVVEVKEDLSIDLTPAAADTPSTEPTDIGAAADAPSSTDSTKKPSNAKTPPRTSKGGAQKATGHSARPAAAAKSGASSGGSSSTSSGGSSSTSSGAQE